MGYIRTVFQKIRDQYKPLGYFRDLPVGILSTANMLDKCSTSIIVPLLPIYAQEMGLTGLEIGLLFALPPLVKGLISPIIGYISDSYSRKPFIIVGMALSAIGVVGLAFVESSLLLFSLRAVDGLGSGLRDPVTNAYLGDYASKENRGQIMGAYQTSGMLAIAIGPALGGALSSIGGISLPFIVLGGATMIGTFVLYPLPNLNPERKADLDLPSIGAISENSSVTIVVLMATAFISQLGTAMIDPLFAPVLQQNVEASPSQIGLAWSAMGVGLLVFLPIGANLSDKRGRVRVIFVGKIMWAAVMFGIATATVAFLPFLLMFMGGVASALLGPATAALRYEVSPENRKASTLGIFGTFTAAGSVIGPLLGGGLSDMIGASNAILVAAALWLIAGLAILLFVSTDD